MNRADVYERLFPFLSWWLMRWRDKEKAIRFARWFSFFFLSRQGRKNGRAAYYRWLDERQVW